MAKTIMIQGTASHVGKSVIAAALCRIFAREGYRVAPFKSWNMALNSHVTADGGEIGRAQGEQAEAAGIEATVHMNPILVKPKGKGQAQVIVRGQVHGDMDYSTRTEEEYVALCMNIIGESLSILHKDYEILVIEGAGSPAEINLAAQDVANMKVAHLADAPVLLVGDVNQGGALAAVVGTMMLLPAEDNARVAGFIFNKFRGDLELLQPGLDVVEERTGRPVIGVVPYVADTGLAEEDGVALERIEVPLNHGENQLRIAVLRLPHISNFTDLDALAAESDVSLHYCNDPEQLSADMDAVIIPGTKNSMNDLTFLQETGLAAAVINLAARGVPVVGICGGYQILGQTLSDPDGRESGGAPLVTGGLGLLATDTNFFPEKRVTRARAEGLLPFAEGCLVEGYEIHMGQTERHTGCLPAFQLITDSGDKIPEGAVSPCGNIWGTYLHGVFDKPVFRRTWLNTLRLRKGWVALAPSEDAVVKPIDRLADHVRASLDMDAIYAMMGLNGPKRGES